MFKIQLMRTSQFLNMIQANDAIHWKYPSFFSQFCYCFREDQRISNLVESLSVHSALEHQTICSHFRYYFHALVEPRIFYRFFDFIFLEYLLHSTWAWAGWWNLLSLKFILFQILQSLVPCGASSVFDAIFFHTSQPTPHHNGRVYTV